MKWKQVQTAYQLHLWWAALVFWLAAGAGLNAMAPDAYGDIATAIPVKSWAGAIMSASTVYLLGIFINGRWRWSSFLRMFGAAFHVASFTLFTVSAYTAPGGILIIAFGSGFLLANAWFFWLNLIDLIGAVRRWDNG